MPAVLAIGCTDPWNAAGLGLDGRALVACGVRPLTVVAGVTAQNRSGLIAAQAISPDVLSAQLQALANADVAALRIGALLDIESVRIVASFVRAAGLPSVYDPVLGPSGGGSFCDDATIAAIRRELVPAVSLVTPNLAEVACLLGQPQPHDAQAMERAAAQLRAAGAQAALVKGGHLAGDVVDVLVDGGGTVRYAAPRLAGTLRGTGCLLACGIAAALASGRSLRDAVVQARAFVHDRFTHAVEFGGMRVAF